MTDIPLEFAIVVWSTQKNTVNVVRGPVNPREWNRIESDHMAGACFSYWAKCSDQIRLMYLFREAFWLSRKGVDPNKIHEALMVIPEYRTAIGHD